MSATQRRFGAGAVKSRSSRSDGLSCPGPAGTVVRGLFLLAATPAIPSPPISRSTVHRATSIPSRRNSRHTFREAYGRARDCRRGGQERSEEHTSELQSRSDLVCRLLL